MKTAAKLSLLALGLVVFGTVSAQAQNNASINATASVQSPIVVTAGVDLAFANVFPGVNKTVAPASGGTFSVTGQATTPVTLQFTLPANLISGGNTLPIGSWAGLHNTTNATAGATAFVPAASVAGSTLSGTGQLFLWIGAQVTPAVSQAAGSYTGAITLTVVY
jgi:hypothetical protein